ncbi:MAG: SET domain-containing protein [Rhodospirillales bacterium]
MIHPDTRLGEINAILGVGIFATKDIPQGTITWCRVDLDIILSARQTKRLPRHLRQDFLKYAHRSDQGYYILNWNNGRYQNHSCKPTSALIPNLESEISISDIAAVEQITSNYGAYNLDGGFNCSCGASTCRSNIAPEDKALRLQELKLKLQLAEALRQLDHVAQPLRLPSNVFPELKTNASGSSEDLTGSNNVLAPMVRRWKNIIEIRPEIGLSQSWNLHTWLPEQMDLNVA